MGDTLSLTDCIPWIVVVILVLVSMWLLLELDRQDEMIVRMADKICKESGKGRVSNFPNMTEIICEHGNLSMEPVVNSSMYFNNSERNRYIPLNDEFL